jgi:hypothetical protein
MRHFFLRDKELTRCGTRTGSGRGGIAYFCPACGEIWGRVELGSLDWAVANWPCSLPCGTHRAYACPGSFLRILSWWDKYNGTSLSQQLGFASEELIRYEAERHIEWRLNT